MVGLNNDLSGPWRGSVSYRVCLLHAEHDQYNWVEARKRMHHFGSSGQLHCLGRAIFHAKHMGDQDRETVWDVHSGRARQQLYVHTARFRSIDNRSGGLLGPDRHGSVHALPNRAIREKDLESPSNGQGTQQESACHGLHSKPETAAAATRAEQVA